MIIQNSSLMNQAAPPAVRTHGADLSAPKVVADTPVAQKISAAELKSAVETLNKAMQQSNQNLEFSVDTGTKKVVVRMVDTSTGQLIRQFPTEETLAISRDIEQFQLGLLFTQKA